MGREVRRVPLDWHHPVYRYGTREDAHMPLHEGINFEGKPAYEVDLAAFFAKPEEWTYRPTPYYYMPVWTEEQAPGWQMYENVSEGTPISPVFPTPEALATWLAEQKSDGHGWFTRNSTYEQWLSMIHAGSAPSMAVVDGRMMTGVEYVAESAKDKDGES